LFFFSSLFSYSPPLISPSQHNLLLQPAPGLLEPHHPPEITPLKLTLHLIAILKELFRLVEQEPILALSELPSVLRPPLDLVLELRAGLVVDVTLVGELHVAEHSGGVLERERGGGGVRDQADDVRAQGDVAEFVVLVVGFLEVLLDVH